MDTYFKIHYGLIIAALYFCCKSSDTKCSSNTFGPNCDFYCHCLNSEQCNSSTGNCLAGCDFAWVGPACQHKNILPVGNTNENVMVTRHQSNIPKNHFAALAVDSNLSTCSKTNFANMSNGIPFWRLWLESGFKVRKISIVTNKDSLDYFKNFEVMVEINSGRYSNGYQSREVCYKHDNSPPTTTNFDVTCNKSTNGNQLRIRLATNGTQLVLCDVRIYGECSDGTFGVSCTEKCSAHCNDVCDKDYGTCTSCSSGWTGTRCNHQVCDDGKYGERCEFNCSGNCHNSTICRTTDGFCVDGCNLGYEGDKCDQLCLNRKYGENCAHDCSGFCRNNSVCRKTDGICVDGCSPGYKGEKCDQPCVSGSYGMECKNICSRFCFQNESRYCSHVNGSCLHGCQAGWQGTKCDTMCHDGKYGSNCIHDCSAFCRNNSACRKTDGICVNGCSPGYKGEKCDHTCVSGSYGMECKKNCSRFCFQNGLRYCSHVNGSCLYGCQAGWQDTHCDTRCVDGKYGTNCTLACSGNCINNSACNKEDGSCDHGCKAGYLGNRCNEKCKDGFYGTNCTLSCSAHCLNETICMHTNGTCMNGCDPGWTNDICKEECQNGTYGAGCIFNCSTHCINGTICLPTNGFCKDGCDPGWTGNTCMDECLDGSYGNDCGSNCSGHCANDSSCRITDGYCAFGCEEGWTSATCDEKCPDRTYGLNCMFNCSTNCLNGSVCLHTNGSCEHGCVLGWVGHNCQQQNISEAEKYVNTNGITENFVAFISSGIAGVVLLLVVVIVSYWKRKAINGKFQAFYERNKNSDENVFHNDIYVTEHVGTENTTNVTDQAMADQSTESVYTITSLADTQLHSVQESEHSCKTYSDTNAFAASNDKDYYNFMPAKRTPYAISVSELDDVMKKNCLIEGYFKSQFETIPSGLLHPTTVANRPKNRHKNRYKNMYPYDHCRVKLKELKGQPDSDYINASFIKGQWKDKAYIASQGPVKENVNDFWRMVWEMNVRMVVMVTNLSENGKMKCIKYWGNEDEVVSYGKIHVTTQTENVFSEFTIRDIKLFHQDDVQTTRNVTQLQFTAWPDKDVPNTSSSLLQFWRKVRQNDENKDHVWLVHCSAGVGRTGTFLAMDILFDQGEKMGIVDMYNCVHDLRKQRVKMVQTYGQYIYLHKLMLEILSLPSKPINVDEFMTIYHQLKKKDKKSGKMKLLVEYKSMESEVTWPAALNNQQEASEREEDLDISADAFRPILSNYVPGSVNTIKATYVPSYYDLYEFIIAQWRPQFKMETCRLVFEKKIETVVTFPADQQYDEIFFEESVSEDDPFVVVCQSQNQKEHYAVKEHVLQTGKEKHYFKEIIFKCWSSESVVPEDTNAFLGLMTEVDAQREYLSEYARKSVLFQCWDGVDRSGLVAVLLNVLDRVLADREVSIPHVIRQLRYNKKELISSFEQYKFCYDVLYCRQESNATYANV